MEHIASQQILEVIDRLPHSKGRVPFTYHHDYLRTNVKSFCNLSRSEVAAEHTSTDLELYAVALVQLLDELGSNAFVHLSATDIYVCKKVKEIVNNLLEKYK
jgi:hypothetical protein